MSVIQGRPVQYTLRREAWVDPPPPCDCMLDQGQYSLGAKQDRGSLWVWGKHQ